LKNRTFSVSQQLWFGAHYLFLLEILVATNKVVFLQTRNKVY